MTEKPKETPKEELECPKKYVYDTGIIFECKDNIKVEIIGEDVVDLLNEQQEQIVSQSHVIAGYQQTCDGLFKENQKIKSIIKESIQLERTSIGKSVLKQLAEALEMEV